MARLGKIKAYEWESGGKKYKVFSKLGGLSAFVSGLTEIDTGEAESTLQIVSGHSRRAYPGAQAKSVASHQRIVIKGGDLPGRTLPGQNAYIEVTTGTGTAAKTEVTTVTFTGSFTDFHAWMVGSSAGGFILRSPDGIRYPIAVNETP